MPDVAPHVKAAVPVARPVVVASLHAEPAATAVRRQRTAMPCSSHLSRVARSAAGL